MNNNSDSELVIFYEAHIARVRELCARNKVHVHEVNLGSETGKLLSAVLHDIVHFSQHSNKNRTTDCWKRSNVTSRKTHQH